MKEMDRRLNSERLKRASSRSHLDSYFERESDNSESTSTMGSSFREQSLLVDQEPVGLTANVASINAALQDADAVIESDIMTISSDTIAEAKSAESTPGPYSVLVVDGNNMY